VRKIRKSTDIYWVRGGAVGWGTALQAGRSRLRFQIMSCFIDIILPAALWLWGSLRLQHISWGQRRAVYRGENPTTFMCRLSWNLRALTSRNPQGLSRPVMRLLYLFTYIDRLWTGRPRNRRLISRRNEDYLLSAVPVSLWCRVGLLFNGCRGGLPRGKTAVSWSTPLTTDVKNGWSYTSIPTYIFMACTRTTLAYSCTSSH
jgi:hypothetical protein